MSGALRAGSVSFADRADAARQLINAVHHLRGTRPVVAGIPRGAVPMASTLARALEGDLDVLLVHKIGHPQNPEVAVGSVDEAGNITRWNGFGLSDGEIGALAGPEIARLRARRQAYARVRSPVDLNGRVVLIVDDGLATGATMLAAIRSAKLRGASRVIAVAPVASREAVALIEREADEVIVLAVPDWFAAVGAFYRNFDTVTDEDALVALRGAS